jgi:hypothetical protein
MISSSKSLHHWKIQRNKLKNTKEKLMTTKILWLPMRSLRLFRKILTLVNSLQIVWSAIQHVISLALLHPQKIRRDVQQWRTKIVQSVPKNATSKTTLTRHFISRQQWLRRKKERMKCLISMKQHKMVKQMLSNYFTSSKQN